MKIDPPICVGFERAHWGSKSTRYITSVSVNLPGKSFKLNENVSVSPSVFSTTIQSTMTALIIATTAGAEETADLDSFLLTPSRKAC